MTVNEFVQELFTRAPYLHTTAYAALYRAVVSKLKRDGVRVGKGAFLPRVEVYGFIESERQDKEGSLREFTFTVESISDKSQADCAQMNADNLERLTGSALDLGSSFTFVGLIPEQLQDLTETGDTERIIYRLLQTYRAFVEKAIENN